MTETSTAPVDNRRPVILDYSPTVSDVGALAFLASHPEIRLVAVTLPGTGESYCEPGVAHTRGILELFGLADVPVACGPDRPVGRHNSFPIGWRQDSNQMDLPEGEPNESRPAPQLIGDLIRTSDSPIEIVAVGPLTNLATAFADEPELTGMLGGITIMGGAVDVPGNVFRNEVGEWNFWVDPTAAKIVFASGAPITLVPLDATNDLPTGPVFFEALDEAADTPAADLVRDVWQDNGAWIDNADGFFFFWDELAAAVLVDESLVTFEERTLLVDDDSFDNEGWTRDDAAGMPIRVATSADRLAFEALFLETLAGRPVESRYLEATPEEIAYFGALEDLAFESQESFDEIFASKAEDLGFGDDVSDEEFIELLTAVIPAILEGPLANEIEVLQGLAVPGTLIEYHDAYLAALVALVGSGEELIASFERGETFGFIADLETACTDLENEAQRRALVANLLCFSDQ